MGVWTQCEDVLAHGCIVCPCKYGWWMVWTHRMQTDEGKEKKEKKKNPPEMVVVDVGMQECRCVACVYGCI